MKAPLKTVLKNFLDHVENLEQKQVFGDDQYQIEFHELKKLTDKLKEDPSYPCSVGLKDVNRPKNRYKDIVPYDVSRVILPKYDGIPGSDYINASYVKGASGAFAYIAAQGPLPNTVIDFWRMIWVCDVQVVIMACNEKEAGKFKCEAYWPNPGEVREYGDITIELISTSQVCSDFMVRTFLVKCDSELRDVYQFHYTTWPDHGVPDSVQPILDLVRLMRDCQASETVPIVVHCSAGCGRTGTICAVDYVWACLRQGKLDEDFSLFHIALELRRQRIAMIQTKEQYILAHKAVATMFEQQLRVIDCHIYENIDEDGEPLMWKDLHKNQEMAISASIARKSVTEELKTENNPIQTELSIENKNISEKPEKGTHMSTEKRLGMKSIGSSTSSGKNSESSMSRNSILSEQSNDDSIPFIDDDEVCIRPNCGRAYLDFPSCNSISKLVNCFDPFVDKVSIGTDDSSPDGDPFVTSNKMKDFQRSSIKSHDKSIKSHEHKSTNKINDDQHMNAYVERNTRDSGNEIDKSLNDEKGAKKVGKATVVRGSSISKLRSLFEKSSIRNSSDGSKRLLFRNNSQHVSRAGSAPPSLNCMDKSYAVEKQSILMMVTRKFRSSSVRTEREMQSKHNDKASGRKGAANTLKDSIGALTRTMSFNISKTFKSYSPSKPKLESKRSSSTSATGDEIPGVYIPKSPDSDKGNSMWYDKPCLPRAIAIVKPTGNFDPNVKTSLPKTPPPTPPKPQDKIKSPEQNFSYKPTKIKEYFNSLNKKEAKDSSTLWYNELNQKEFDSALEIASNTDTACASKVMSKTLPFLPLTSWKKIGYKSPVVSPDNPKSFIEPVQPCSKFYTDVLPNAPHVSETEELPKNSEINVPKCPVPEEIIPLNSDGNKFWHSNSSVTLENKTNASDSIENISKQASETKNNNIENMDKLKIANDIPPAIPKKMVIGKNKINSDVVPENEIDSLSVQQMTKSTEKLNFNLMPDTDKESTNSKIPDVKDKYMNVNVKALKNIEQIENTLRKNPRGAIIDLTSRESYSMEEELVNAVNQLTDTSEENKSLQQEEVKPQNAAVKNSSKFPGYEVIWPEGPSVPIEKSKSSSKVLPNISSIFSHDVLGRQKADLGYSPPLRRSINANLSHSKSQSCGNLDGIEQENVVKDIVSVPTKKLVKEAVVELNTLLNQLTSKTLSEDFDTDLNSKKCNVSDPKTCEKTKFLETQPNDTVIESVTLITKSQNFGESPKEEEIIFHFPPPPRGPPPKDTLPVESFNIICKNGSLIVKEANSNANESEINKHISSPSQTNKSLNYFPQPAPRKSKQTDELRRSSSFTNISYPSQNKNSRYENLFFEKYQTLSRLQIKQELDESSVLDKSVPLQKCSIMHTTNSKPSSPSYVNVMRKQCKGQNGKQEVTNFLIRDNKWPIDKTSELFPGNSKNDSAYGTIYKVTADRVESSSVTHNSNHIGNSEEAKRKPLPSKKTERAPMPPSFKPGSLANNDTALKITQNLSMIPKKIPSRKLEKAPQPPFQKSPSEKISHRESTDSLKYPASTTSADLMNEKPKLPILRENLPNIPEPSPNCRKTKNNFKPCDKLPNVLSYSKSDTSLFKFLKERQALIEKQRKIQHQNLKLHLREREKIKNESINMSSSDSDSSYERILLTQEETVKNSVTEMLKEPEHNSTSNNERDLPIAPPRAKRRATTEVEYTKVKAKDASFMQYYASKNMFQEKKKNHTAIPKTREEPPPAIPLKTKDAFEIP